MMIGMQLQMVPLLIGRVIHHHHVAPWRSTSTVTATAFVVTSYTTKYGRSGARTATVCSGRLFSSTSSANNSSNNNNNIDVEISPATHKTKPLQRYSVQEVDKRLAKALQAQGITLPTPIQAHGIPLLRAGHDVMASAQTGTGKTLLFGIPILERLMQTSRNKNTKGPTALILNPTRELALQTASAIEALAQHNPQQSKIKVALATGGASVSQQRSQIQQPHDILVATPGRLLQFLDDRTLSLKDIQNVVCDESDRMVDLGFEPQLRRIAKALGAHNQQQHDDTRQTLLCSATFPPDVQRVAADFLKADYYFIAVGRVGATHTSIDQTVRWADSPQQRSQLALEEIKNFMAQSKQRSKQNQSQVIVFCNTKDEAERLGGNIRKSISPKVRVVTGDKDQKERNRSLEDFRKGKIPILVATDVAARGLDVPTIGLVVQVDTPRDADSYVHRVGRTGRAGATGAAVAFMDGRSMGVAASLVELLQEANQDVPSWLRGMSYVSRARILEEEGAIAAGGGEVFSAVTAQQVSSDGNISSDSIFSEQDFRSNAEAGSWGSERDTSYHQFDDEAYGSLDAAEMISSLDKTKEEGPLASQSSICDDSFVNDRFVKTTEPQKTRENSNQIDQPFERQQLSRELRDVLKRISGSDTVEAKPRRDVYSKLSQRGSNQRLRFEYLGLFPFDNVQDLLLKKEENRGNDGTSDNKLPRVLMVAEKPSIAKAIADALSGPRGARQKRGISRALPVYEFTSNAFAPSPDDSESANQQPHKIIVTSVVGHVFSLGFDKQANKEKQDPSEYFRMPVVKQEEDSTAKLRVVDHLRALAAECDHLVLWLDCDAEGENIAHEVIGVTRHAIDQKMAQEAQANPNFAPQRRVHRAQFSAISKEALVEAFSNLGEPDALLSRSVDARQELDLRVGVALTRLLTWRCVGLARSRFSAATKFISYGPCQTPALSFCVGRAREIDAFEPQPYWKVHVTTKSPQLNLRWIPPAGSEVASNRKRGARSKDGKTAADMEASASFDMEAAQQMVALSSGRDSYATVFDVENVSERISPPLGLNTVALLTAGSKAMGMSPKKVMQVAEKLYSGGYISYPRTETTKYDPLGFDARAMLREHLSHPQWGKTATYLLRTKYGKSGRPPQRGHNAGDHPPITCLRAATREEIGGGAEWRVYEFVVRNFLGSLSDELLYTRQVARLQLNDGDAGDKFEVQQIQVDNLGFAGACPWLLKDVGVESKNKNGGEITKQIQFREGMKLPIANARVEACQTRPPGFLQEHELIELMDKNRIGTDASMATHVTNIVERGYVTLTDEVGDLLRPPRPPRPGQKQLPRQIGRYLVPTSLGISLVDLFDRDNSSENEESPALLSRPSIRAQMEEEVRQIAIGKLDKAESLDKNLAWFEARYNELEESLSRERTQEFGRALVPIKESLRYWQKLGAFEDRPKGGPSGGPRNHSRGKQQGYQGQSKGGGGGSRGKPKSGQWNRPGSKQTIGKKKGDARRGKSRVVS